MDIFFDFLFRLVFKAAIVPLFTDPVSQWGVGSWVFLSIFFVLIFRSILRIFFGENDHAKNRKERKK